MPASIACRFYKNHNIQHEISYQKRIFDSISSNLGRRHGLAGRSLYGFGSGHGIHERVHDRYNDSYHDRNSGRDYGGD
jgi:hypothetical protein